MGAQPDRPNTGRKGIGASDLTIAHAAAAPANLIKPMNEQQAHRLREIQAMYRRFLSGWASDVLQLRASGGTALIWRDPREAGDAGAAAA
jgi:hypothetical protein